MATTSRAGLAAGGVIGVSMPMRNGVSAPMSALEIPAAGKEEAGEPGSPGVQRWGRAGRWRRGPGDKKRET